MPLNLVQLTSPINNIVVIRSGIVPKGAYSADTTYSIGDFVSYSGSSYVLYVDATAGTVPTDTNYWMIVAQGA